MTAGWGSRTVRAAVFAVVCVLLAALGHVMMSGSSVPWWAMAGGAVVTGGAGWSLTGRERGPVLIVSVVVVAQGLLHTAFSLAQPLSSGGAPGPAGMDPMSMDSLSMGSMSMGSMSMGSMGDDTGAGPMSAMHMGSGHAVSMDAMDLGHMGAGPMTQPGHGMGAMSLFGMSSVGMLTAHLLAALLCGLWLAHGERAVFRILRAVAGRLAAPLRLLLALPTPPHRPRIRGRRGHERWVPRRLLLAHAITSRGPPVGTAVV
ncbi:hypothetical protein ACFVYF_08270 [Streptomyces sp. NPDC058274]|uniref:hypothetical protein n=1 Tax=Streptomyces sp. NPDC058274 TaxID=3346416 RepID=UPI0036E6DC0A